MFSDYPDILTVEELCEMLTIGKNAAYTLLASRQIKAARINNRIWKIPKIAVIEYVLTSSGLTNVESFPTNF
ncbi:excisionase [Sporomusaceae bacterium FL31]|nr:excisionase [Sporomusaceae bacterium FL31]GCE32614.1 excisionase [Sporomusaceae bacterium]